MLTTADKITMEQAQMPVRSIFFPSAWFGEALRQALLLPVLRMFIALSVHASALTGEGPYIFAANHSSHLDAPVFLAALPLRLRIHVRIAAAADYFFTRHWQGTLVRLLLNAFPFERKQPGCRASLVYSERLLRQGHSLLIFPEGTRSRDGQLQCFKRGIGQIACHSGVSVVPTRIDGTFAALPKGARWPRRQTVRVKFGVPLHFSCDDDPACIAAEVERAVRALAPIDPECEEKHGDKQL